MQSSYEIIPAIMPQSYQEFVELVSLASTRSSQVQWDIMDGHFVPNTSWPYSEGGFKNNDWQELVSQAQGLPLWEKVDYEFDLMIANPIETLEQWAALGPKRIILHYDSLPDPRETLRAVQELRPVIEVSLAIHSGHTVEQVAGLIPLIDSIQCMGIKKIGFQGQLFDEKILETIHQLRLHFPDTPISIDGSVNHETITSLAQAGAIRFAVGSALLQGDFAENFKELEQVLDDAQSMIK